MKFINCETVHYAVFTLHLLRHHTYIQILSSHFCHTPSMYIPAIFQADKKRTALGLFVFYTSRFQVLISALLGFKYSDIAFNIEFYRLQVYCMSEGAAR